MQAIVNNVLNISIGTPQYDTISYYVITIQLKNVLVTYKPVSTNN